MKKNRIKNALYALVTFIAFFVVLSSCKKDDTPVEPAVTITLQACVDSCTTLLNSSTVASDYPAAAITEFTTVNNAAKALIANTAATQTQVDNMLVQLRTAKATFLAAAYGAIPANALLMGMTFDETVANNQFKTEGKGWTAVLKTGPSEIFGTSTNLPSFATGKVGKAIYLNNGSHLEVSDYASTSLLGKTLSIAVWVKPETTRAGNYIISYNYWMSWKFNLQTENKPFFTVKTGPTDNDYMNADNETVSSAPNGTWTHLVVCMDLTNQKLDFYVNGALTKSWNATTQPNLKATTQSYATVLPLMIGVATTYAEATTWSWSWEKVPQNWDNFIGSLDELKLYNIALTEGQVAKLYKDENK